jgi:hypothetical protein
MIDWIEPANENLYYPVIQFKLLIHLEDQWLDMADGGLVDWTQKLLHNKKNRMMISGLGLERLYNLKMQDPHVD